MTNAKTKHSPSPYHARLQRVLDHIEAHLGDDLSVDVLSGVAAFSKFHFHRQFTAVVGMSVAKYVQGLRLRRAAHKLAFRDGESILDIALDCGYEGPEAFARAFKKTFSQTPSDYRRQPSWDSGQDTLNPLRETRERFITQTTDIQNVTLITTDDTRVAVAEHRGNPITIGDTARRFITWRKEHGTPPSKSATFNIFYDDPDTTNPTDFRMDICAAITSAVAPNDEGVVEKVIPGGRCAVLRHVGTDASFGKAAHALYGEWLPNSGEELRDFPLYCQRITFFPDVAEHEAVTELFLPLK